MIMDAWESASQEIVYHDPFDTVSALSYKTPTVPPNHPDHGQFNNTSMPATILIADDHEDNRELLRLLLTGAGYNVREARDGNECLGFARNEPPNLIVMDLSMPVLDGWGLLRELRADERTQAIPCMVVTAHADFARNDALQTGFAAYVSKPYTAEAILDTIARILAEQ
jgi:CheY-like chemotaxis protein